MFSLDAFVEENPSEKDSFTKLTIEINNQQSFGRAKTFFSKYPDSESLKQWLIENFFPFIVNNERLEITINFNGNSVEIKKDNIETEFSPISFEISHLDESDSEKKYQFTLWLIKTTGKPRQENHIECFARNLKAELVNEKLVYTIDNEDSYLYYLTSDYFDENVDTKGEK